MTRAMIVVGVVAAVLAVAGFALGTGSATWFGGRSQPTVEVAVLAAASGFVRAHAAYDTADVQAHLDAVSPWVTPAYRDELAAQLPRLYAVGAARGQRADNVRLPARGLRSLTGDTAEVLVAVDSTVAAGRRQVEREDRWLVSLVRDGADWRVAGYTALPPGGPA